VQSTQHAMSPPAARSVTSVPVTSTTSTAADGRPFYSQPGIHVTQDWFIVAGRRFPVGELHNLRTARGPADQLTIRSVTVTAIMLAGVGIMLGMTTELNHLSAQTYLALTAVAFVPFLVATIGHRLRPRAYELWGEVHGLTMLLFTCDQQRQYGQVTRALLRAKEATRLGAVTEPVASMNMWRSSRR
jgi:hypothetical protein